MIEHPLQVNIETERIHDGTDQILELIPFLTNDSL